MAAVSGMAPDQSNPNGWAFNEIAAASEGPLIYSKATDEELAQLERMREAVRGMLQPKQT